MAAEFSRFPLFLSQHHPADWVNVEPMLYQLRRQKEADELCLIRRAIAGTGYMYERARAIVAPGVSELEVFSQLQASAVEQFGEPPTATGNDYQCGSPGGPPRSGRTARAGEAPTSWTSDPPTAATSPTTAAPSRSKAAPTNSRRPGLAMLQVFAHVEQHVRPGTSARSCTARPKPFSRRLP